MDTYFNHHLRQNANGEYELIVFLDDMSEFSSELGETTKNQTSFIYSVRSFIQERYPKVKISVVKVVVGGLAITTIPLVGGNISAVEAATEKKTSEHRLHNSIYYDVIRGDTLWGLSNQYDSSVDDIKRANNLLSDSLSVHQRLIIPQAFYTIEKGDTLYSISQKYGMKSDDIKTANNLKNDVIGIGQVLVIPKMINAHDILPQTSSNEIQTTYTVVAGDSLWGIANRYNTTVNAIKDENNLPSDLLNIGQQLKIPNGNHSVEKSFPVENVKYRVLAGDSLWLIAQKYGVSVDTIRISNNLDTDNLRVGQILVIPMSKSIDKTSTGPQEKETPATSYKVVKGDTLFSIANRYNISVQHLKEQNLLTGNVISVGQILIIPSANTKVNDSRSSINSNENLQGVQKDLQELGYYDVAATTGSYDNATTTAIKQFQREYNLTVTGKVDEATTTAIQHAVVKKGLINDTKNYLGVPYLWGGTTPSGFDCSGFVYYMFNKHGVNMSRNTSSGLYTQGKSISVDNLQQGDLVFYSINSSGITHVGFYIGGNEWVSATSSKGIAVYSLDNPYWSTYYVGAKRIY